jgi:hypothetical protein
LAEALDSDVLLETVAQAEDAHRQLTEAGNAATTCFLNWLEPEGLLAIVTDDGDAYGND